MHPSRAEGPPGGTQLSNPFPKPDLVLTDTSGQSFDLRKQTAGKATLVFFGYTNCPDVCPTTMGDISTALAKQPQDVRDDTTVVFVTTDRERDTPEDTGRWLRAFGPQFTGLSGDLEKVKKAALGLGTSVEDPKGHADGTVATSPRHPGRRVLAHPRQGPRPLQRHHRRGLHPRSAAPGQSYRRVADAGGLALGAPSGKPLRCAVSGCGQRRRGGSRPGCG